MECARAPNLNRITPNLSFGDSIFIGTCARLFRDAVMAFFRSCFTETDGASGFAKFSSYIGLSWIYLMVDFVVKFIGTMLLAFCYLFI